MRPQPTAPAAPEPGTAATLRWLVGATSDLLPPLALACVLSCLTRFASLGIYLVAALGLAKAAGIQVLGISASWTALALGILALGLAKGALRYGEQYVGHKVAFLSLSRLRNTLYAAAEHQAPFAARSRNSGGLLAVATRDVDRVEVFFAHTLPPAVSAVVVSGAVTWWTWSSFGSAAALVLLAGYVLLGLVIPALGIPTLRRAAAGQARVRGLQNQQLAELLNGIDVVHGYEAGPRMLARFNGTAKPSTADTLRAGRITGLRAALSQAVIWGSVLALLVVAARDHELGALLVLTVIAVPSYEAVRAVDGFVLGLQDSLASAKRLHAMALGEPQVAEPDMPRLLPESGTLSVRGLSVAYGKDTVLSGLDLQLAPGQLVALVGDSGSGKSTAASALVRAVPSTGECSYGGIPLESAPLREVRSHLLLVSQEAVMVRGTLRENLLLGLEHIEDAELVAVLEELGLGTWLASQKQGLDTRLGDRATRLSGGQRQRLALARALIRRPKVLILDESTSALDAASEQLVLAAVEARRTAGMAVLMISHRISILHGADRIVVLREGQVAESGTPEQLLAQPDSLFSRMAVREADRIEPAN